MNETRQRSIDPRLLIPIVGVILVLAVAVFIFFLSGTDDAPMSTGGDPATTSSTNGGTSSGATATATTAGAGDTAAELSVEDAGHQALLAIIEERAVEFAATQGERRNNAQSRILQGGVPAAAQDIRAYAWRDEDGHIVAALAEGESVAGRVCGISISFLDGPLHLPGSVDVQSRPDCDAPSFYQSPIQSAHEAGTLSGDPLVHVVRSAGPLPEGATVHIWAFVAVGDDWDNVGYTCVQECSLTPEGYGDPVTAADFAAEREYLERERESERAFAQWVNSIHDARRALGLPVGVQHFAIAAAYEGWDEATIRSYFGGAVGR